MNLFEFLDRLEAAKIHFDLGRFRDSVNVLITVPGARWEVEFFEDGHIEVEVFRSKGIEADATAALAELFKEHSD